MIMSSRSHAHSLIMPEVDVGVQCPIGSSAREANGLELWSDRTRRSVLWLHKSFVGSLTGGTGYAEAKAEQRIIADMLDKARPVKQGKADEASARTRGSERGSR
jgi:hypothetical protein